MSVELTMSGGKLLLTVQVHRCIQYTSSVQLQDIASLSGCAIEESKQGEQHLCRASIASGKLV